MQSRASRTRVVLSAVASLATLTGMAGCSGDEGPSAASAPSVGTSAGASGTATPSGTSPVPAATAPPGNAPPSAPPRTSAGSAAIPPASPTNPALPAANGGGGPALPQEVCSVLQTNGCVSCHQAQLQGGATMPLQWQRDFEARAKDGAAMGAKVLTRVQDKTAPMPPTTTMRPMLNTAHVDVLRKWIDGGMIGVEGAACEESETPPPTSTSWAHRGWPEGECEYTFTIGAHGAVGTPRAKDDSPYVPPAAETAYHCFYEEVPWGDKKVQALATRVNVEGDDKAIVHHLVMSSLSPGDGMSILGGTKPQRGGDAHECPNPSGSTVAVWAPGPHTETSFPEETGVLMPSGAGAFIELQLHYNNANGSQKSRVSVDICATSKLRPNTAGVHWLGYENATAAVPLAALGPELQPALDNKGNGVAIGNCRAKERARVLWMAPHMHERGKHSKIEILRASGKVEVVHDGPFVFSEQTAYFYDDLWVEKGDVIRSTCTWDASSKVVFGFGSKEEMCFFYTLAYPIGALAGEGAERGVVGGDLTCAGSG